jgi:hypothetical protein
MHREEVSLLQVGNARDAVAAILAEQFARKWREEQEGRYRAASRPQE